MTQPTQVAHPWRATLRTLIQILPMIAATVPAIVDAVGGADPRWIAGWGPVAVAGSLALTRIMAIPGVNDILTRIGLGAEPKAKETPGV